REGLTANYEAHAERTPALPLTLLAMADADHDGLTLDSVAHGAALAAALVDIAHGGDPPTAASHEALLGNKKDPCPMRSSYCAKNAQPASASRTTLSSRQWSSRRPERAARL